MRAIVLQHTATEGPELVATALAARDIAIDVRPLYAGAAVPSDLASDELLIVMGGPMGVGDVADPRWPFLRQEIALLRKLVVRQAPVLGICLGSQLLAAGAGARVYPNTRPGPDGKPVPAREVGWAPVDLLGVDQTGTLGGFLEPPATTPLGEAQLRQRDQTGTLGGFLEPPATTPLGEAQLRQRDREPLLAGLPPRPLVLHWHGDTFDLPIGAVLLASTDVCPNQAFRLGKRQIGLQFHCELEAQTIAVWAKEDAEFARSALGDGATQQILSDTAHFYAGARPIWDRLLANAVDVLLT